MTAVAGQTLIPASHGQLEAIHRLAAEGPRGVALVLHPHPLFGGTMHNPVVFHCARALAEAGFETLRINFRGVGQSSGTYDQGRGELEDALTALDFLLEAQPAAREVVVAGFSFGAGIGLRLGCADPRATRLIAIGTPAATMDVSFLATCGKPKLLVHGERDDLAPLAALRAVLETRIAPPCTLRVIPGADHFLAGEADELRSAVREFVAGPGPVPEQR